MSYRKIFKPTLLALSVATIYATGPGVARAAGNPIVGPLFTLPSSIVGGTPFSLARADSGVFMLGWRGQPKDSTGNFVYNNSIQTFNGDGTPLSSGILLADKLIIVDSSQSKIAVAADPDGDFVTSWIASNPKKLYAQRFSQVGVTKGKQITVASAPQTFAFDWQNNTIDPMIATDTDGDLAVSWSVNPTLAFGWCWGNLYTGWEHGCFGASASTTYASVYNSSGTNMRWQGTGVVARELATTSREVPAALLPQPGGEFLAISDVLSSNSGESYASAQLLNSHAQKVGLAWKPTDPGSTSGNVPGINSAAVDANGNVAVVWQALKGSDSPVYVRRYAANGTPIGDRITVADRTGYEYSNCFFPIVKMTPSGAFVVLWGNDGATDFCEIRAQYFHFDGSPNGTAVTVTDSTDYVTYYGPPAAAIDSSGNLTVVWERVPVQDPWTVVGRNITPPN